MKKRIACGALVVILLLGNLSGCAAMKKQKYSAYSFDYFDTASTITGYAESKEEFDQVADEILAMLEEYHQLYSIYHRFDGIENLCTVNELVDGAHRKVKVDQKIIDLLLYAKEMYEKTDGVLNVAMGSVLSIWHDYRSIGMDAPEEASLPSMQILWEAARHTDINNIEIDEKASTVYIIDALTTIDVGAIAKGYATERIARSLEEQGIDGYVLNIGGNVRTIGQKPDGELWTIGIENPQGGDHLAYMELGGQSLVTSGSYQRYYTVDGKRYHHIIHPDTLMPAEGFLSVSVISGDSGLADALSTALFCMPLKEGRKMVAELPDAEVMWVLEDGSQITSSGWDFYLKQ